MRTRSRSQSSHGKSWYNVVLNIPPSTKFTSTNQFPAPFNTVQSTISDETNVASVDSRAKRRLQQDRMVRQLGIASRIQDPILQRSVISDIYTDRLQVHRCSHSKMSLSDIKDQVLRADTLNGNGRYYAITMTGGASVLKFFRPPTGDVLGHLNSLGRLNSVEGYHEPDWFALLDQWNEACNSIIPSSSLLGESIVENAIFVDAFKAVLNPSRLLKLFLDAGRKIAKRKTNLGKIAGSLRTSADFTLGYEFGVRPAIQEIQNIFSAHRKVSQRLQFLKENRGGYVPIRARQKILSGVSNTPMPSNIACLVYNERSVTGTISGLAKVREDLSFAKDWQAYVQYFGLHKFIGLAWELVPFSFVVDWVTDAQEYINRYTTPQFGSPFYNIRNICYSRKSETKEDLMVSGDYIFSEYQSRLNLGGALKIGSLNTSLYERYPGLPTTSGSVDFSLLGSFQKFLLGTMLVQRRVK